MRAKKLLGSDSSWKVRFQILGNPQMFKNVFLIFAKILRNHCHKNGDQQALFVQPFMPR